MDSLPAKPNPFSIIATVPLPQIFNVTTKRYNYFGVYKPDHIAKEGIEFIQRISTVADVHVLYSALHNFLKLTAEDYARQKQQDKESSCKQSLTSCWLTIRMTEPTDRYTKNPRWHRDGRMYSPDNEDDINSKYAITLLGNSTRVLAETELVTSVMALQRVMKKKRECTLTKAAAQIKLVAAETYFAEKLRGEPVVSIENGQVIRFTWGQEDSPVHSEPGMSTERLFVFVIYGSEQEIRQMCAGREEGF